MDRILCSPRASSAYNQVVEEQQCLKYIAKIFNQHDTIYVTMLLTSNQGLITLDIRKCISVLEAFYHVLRCWLNVPQILSTSLITNSLP